MKDIFEELKIRKVADKKKFEEANDDLCMICYAYGPDKRNLTVECFYDVKEAVPEMLETERGYWARICKSCRGSFLGKMTEWREERVAVRDLPKGHDGDIYEDDESKNIPVRINGAIVMMNEEEYTLYKSKKQ